MGTLGHAATGPVAFGAPVRPYEAAKPKSADRPSRVSVWVGLSGFKRAQTQVTGDLIIITISLTA